jgi:hypothetical protein
MIAALAGLSVRVRRRNVEASDGVAFEIDLNENCGLVTEYAGIVAWFDDDGLWCHERRGATIGILDAHLALYEEADVRVHAQRRTNGRPDVRRPAIAGRIDDPFDPGVARFDDVFVNTAHAAVHRACDRRMTWICARVSHGDRLSTPNNQFAA